MAKKVNSTEKKVHEAIAEVYKLFRESTDTVSEAHARVMFIETFLIVWNKLQKK